MTRSLLTIEFHDYWHIGSGRGEGKHLDSVVDKDESGLPFVPGRIIKGLLRDALHRLEVWNNPGINLDSTEMTTQELFGGIVSDLSTTTRHDTTPGCLFVGDARLPEDLRIWLSHSDQITQRQNLYRQVFSTAINESSGSAKENSLRGIEVVIPLTLISQVEVLGNNSDAIINRLKRALPLI